MYMTIYLNCKEPMTEAGETVFTPGLCYIGERVVDSCDTEWKVKNDLGEFSVISQSDTYDSFHYAYFPDDFKRVCAKLGISIDEGEEIPKKEYTATFKMFFDCSPNNVHTKKASVFEYDMPTAKETVEKSWPNVSDIVMNLVI
jgi:hypothetical protein